MKYSHAFECQDCPETSSEKGCPLWWEFMVRDNGASQDRLMKMCGYQAMPRFLTEVIAASNRPAAAVESMRNEISDKIHAHTLVIADGLTRIAAELPKKLEKKK